MMLWITTQKRHKKKSALRFTNQINQGHCPIKTTESKQMSVSIQSSNGISVVTENGHVKVKGKVKSVSINGNKVESCDSDKPKAKRLKKIASEIAFGFTAGVITTSLVFALVTV